MRDRYKFASVPRVDIDGAANDYERYWDAAYQTASDIAKPLSDQLTVGGGIVVVMDQSYPPLPG